MYELGHLYVPHTYIEDSMNYKTDICPEYVPRIWCRWVMWQHFCCNCRVIANGKLHWFGWWSHQLPMELKYQGFFLALHFMHTYKHVQIRHTIRATLVMKSYKEHLFPKMRNTLIWPIPPYLETHFTVSHIELLTISVLIQDWLKCITVFSYEYSFWNSVWVLDIEVVRNGFLK